MVNLQEVHRETVRTETHIYVEYSNAERELYDLRNDPYQLRNVYGSADPSLLEDLRQRLDALENCAGKGCRAAENGRWRHVGSTDTPR